MGDPSYFIAVAKNFALDWDKLSAHKREAILKLLQDYNWSGDYLPRTFKSLMKVFGDCKFYGYLVPPLTTVLSDLLPIFPETGYAIFIAYCHPVVFVFDPSARSYQILTGSPVYDGVGICEYHSVQTNAPEGTEPGEAEERQVEEVIAEAEPDAGEEKKEEDARYPSVRRSKRLIAVASKDRSSKKQKSATKTRAVSATARFRDEVMLPLLVLPATEDPGVFLRHHGFKSEALLSQHHLDMLMMFNHVMSGGQRMPLGGYQFPF